VDRAAVTNHSFLLCPSGWILNAWERALSRHFDTSRLCDAIAGREPMAAKKSQSIMTSIVRAAAVESAAGAVRATT
jgi:hypothetical protein